MGAKSPAKLKLRRPTYKCDICHRKLLSAQALKTHQYCIHKISASSSDQRGKAMKPKAKKVLPEKAKPKTTPTNDTEANTEDLVTPNVTDVRKIEYECPICNVMFLAYYPAYRHIQKKHCVNSRGQKVEATSADLIKPLRVEMCVKCSKRIRANDAHCCWETPLLNESGLDVQYQCTGCKQQFNSMQLFDLHVSGLHSDGVESMFFPSMNDFLTWKRQMQTKTKVDYLILGKCNTKQTYRCTYLPPAETTTHTNVSDICPSSIVVQEFTKGIQVHFYKKHHGHNCPEYTCPDQFKKFLITALMEDKNPQSYDVRYDEKDIYCQFKVLLESIIVEAAKLKIDDLKLMLEKALEMTSILNNYDEDDDTYTYSNKQKQVLCEERISKALENIKNFQMKRKASDDIAPDVDPKKMTPRIINAFSMASKNGNPKEATVEQKKEVMNKVNEVKKDDVPSPRILRNTLIQSSPSFNDQYKDFVDKNFLGKSATAENSTPRSTSLGKQPVKRASPVPRPPRGVRVRPLSKLIEPSEIEKELAKDFIEVPVPTPTKNETQSKQADKSNICPEITVKKVPPKEKVSKDSIDDSAKRHTKELRESTIRKENPPAIRKENSPAIRKENPPAIRKENPPAIRKENPPAIRKENPPAIRKENSPAIQKENPPAIRKENSPAIQKEDPPAIRKENPPAIRKEFRPRTKPRKQVMKTKIGQFKASLSPKSPSPKKPNLNKSFSKIKPDIEYEVMEQENDCNILILKI